MSDDFDKNDWLDNNEDDAQQPQDDDLNLDWLKDDSGEEKGAPPGDRTGVTGELSWLQGFESAPDAPAGDADDLSWLSDAGQGYSGQPGEASFLTGMTDEFEDHLSDMPLPGEQPASEGGMLDAPWLAGLDDEFDDDQQEPFAEEEPETPAWMQSAAPDEEEAPAPTPEIPEWMQQHSAAFSDEAPTGQAGPEDVPDWLRGASDHEEEAPAPQADEMPEWMQQHSAVFSDEAPASPPADSGDIPDWMRETGLEAEPEPEEAAPSGTPIWADQVPEEEEEAVEVPPWLAGLPVPGEVQPPPGPAYEPETEDKIPDWLQSDESFAEEEAQPAAAATSFDDMQFDEMFAETSGEELPDFEMLTAEGEPAFDDLLGDEFADEEAQPVDDFFASIDVSGGAGEAFDDMLGELAEDAPPAAAGQEAFDDIFGEIAEEPPVSEEAFDAPVSAGAGAEFDDMLGEIAEPEEEEPLTAEFDDMLGELAEEEAPSVAEEEFDALFAEEALPVAPPPEMTTELDFSQLGGEEDFDHLFADESPAGETFDDAAYEDMFEEEEAEEAPSAVQLDDAYLQEMGIGKPKEDWFADLEPTDEAADWLQELGDIGDLDAILAEQPAAEPELEEAAAVPTDADFLSDLMANVPEIEPEPVAEPLLEDIDIDQFLSGYEAEDLDLPKTGELELATNAEVEELFDTGEFDNLSPEEKQTGRRTLGLDVPDFLAGVTVSVSEEAPSALVRKRKERPLEELDERLQSLSERGRELTPAAPAKVASSVLSDLLPDVPELIPVAPLEIVTPQAMAAAGTMQLTDQQRQRAGLLKSVVGATSVVKLPTGDFDWGADIAEPEAAKAERKALAKKRRAPRFQIDRIVIAALLAAVIVLPFFVRGFQIGALPARSFAFGSRQQNAFNLIDTLQPGDLVLVGVEYGPTGAGELDDAADAVLHHILMRGAYPILIGGNPVGMLHANNILQSIGTGDDAPFLVQLGRSTPFVANQDYFVLRYLTGSIVGLRTLGQDATALLQTDIEGNPTGLNVRSVRDFDLIIVMAESADDVRAWAEQVVPVVGKPLLAVTGQAAAPLSEPYTNAQIVGYRDAYTYERMLSVILYGDFPEPTVPPTTEPPVIEPTALPSEATAAVETTQEATPEGGTEVTPAARATFTPRPPTATFTPTATATFTASPTPTDTATPTNTFTPTATPLPIAVVIASQAINVRSGPGTSFEPVGTLTPGTRILVLGANEDGTWLNVLLGDGQEGWVSAQLLEIEPTPTPGGVEEASPTPEGNSGNDTLRRDDLLGRPYNTAMGGGSVKGRDTALSILGEYGRDEIYLVPTTRDVDVAYQIAATEEATPVPEGLDSLALTATAALDLATQMAQTASSDSVFMTATALLEQVQAAQTTTGDSLLLTATAVIEQATQQAQGTTVFGTPAPDVTQVNLFAGDGGITRPEKPYKDERWFAMTAGLVVIVLVIAAGNLYNLIRFILRRGDRS